MTFSDAEIEQFVSEGYVMLRGGFSREVAAECCEFIWNKIGQWEDCAVPPDRPMVLVQKCFAEAPFDRVMNVRLKTALEQLMGLDRVIMHERFGWWQVLFPAGSVPSVWHIDGANFHHHLTSPEQALVTVYFFSDIGPKDGGTRLVRGSHYGIARLLAEAEPAGLDCAQLNEALPPVDPSKIVEVTGEAGDVAMLHPFLIHGMGRNRGQRIRFACNPQYQLKEAMKIERPDHSYSPVELAIRRGLSLE